MDRFLSTDVDPNLLSPLDLAFIGDCVYELFVREALVTEANRPTSELHREKVKLVNANAQEAAAHEISQFLTEEEKDIYRRAQRPYPPYSEEYESPQLSRRHRIRGAFRLSLPERRA